MTLETLKDAIPGARVIFIRKHESLWIYNEGRQYTALNDKTGFTDSPLLSNGRVLYDFPERWSAAFKKQVHKHLTNSGNIGRSRKAAIQLTERAVLVYQAGIANVFAVDCFNAAPYGRNAKRLLQHAFSPCEYFARGLAAAGVAVATMQCNQAGDITNAQWSENLEGAPFSDKFSPVFSMVLNPRRS